MLNNSTLSAIIFMALTYYSSVANTQDNPWADPIWKSPPVPEHPDAEFDSHDPYALGIGVRIKTDCSIRFVYHQDGKLYCFNSLTSKAFFMDYPKKYIRDANAFLYREEQLKEDQQN